jgi:hypothetical protein
MTENHRPFRASIEVELARVVIVFGLASALLLVMIGTPARADIALCPSFGTPSSDVQALRRTPFAFDGLAVDGRVIDDPERGVELVSPLTFRVTRWIKGGSSYGTPLPSGAEAVRIWDGRYARLSPRLLNKYSANLELRFPGEIVAVPGQAWRVYATNENGVNFTCTNLLGSHPLGPSEFAPSSPPRSLGPSGSSRPGPHWGLGLGLALLGVVALFAAIAIRRFGAGRGRS